jgi:hypothetical protein
LIPLVLKSTAVILAAALAAAAFRRRSAATRHLVWAVGLVGALAIPLASMLLPSWSWENPLVEPGLAGPQPEVAFAVWLAGAAAGLAWMLASAGRLAWVAFGARPFRDARWLRHLSEVAAALGLRRPVRLIQNSRAGLLGTWGILKPHILLPRSAETWSDLRIRVVLAHELAHARRRDWPVQVLAEAARAIYWFNPFFWLAARRLRAESEHASDDAVVALGIDGADYAEELVGLTQALGEGASLSLPALGILWPSQLERRLRNVLDPSMERLAATPWSIVLVVGAAVCLTLPIAALRSGYEPAPDPTQPALPKISEPESPEAALEPAQTPAAVESPIPAEAPAEVLALGHVALPGTDPVLSDFSALGSRTHSAAGSPLPLELPPVPPLAIEDAGADRSACAVTPTVDDAPEDPPSRLLGRGPWYVNGRRTIWVWAQPWVAGQLINAVWIRPVESRLQVSAKRLDAAASAAVSLASPGLATFKTGGLLFPEAGCWEVTALAGSESLVFVTEVVPGFSSPGPTGSPR